MNNPDSLHSYCDILATLIDHLLNEPDYAIKFIETMDLIAFHVTIYHDRYGVPFTPHVLSDKILESFYSYFNTNTELQQLSLHFNYKYFPDKKYDKNTLIKFYDELQTNFCYYLKYKYHLNINFTNLSQKSPIHQKVSVWDFAYSKLLSLYKLQLKARLLVDFNSQLSKCSTVSDYKLLAKKLL